jgi:hypothetical protein
MLAKNKETVKMRNTINKNAFNGKSTNPSNPSKSSKKSLFSWKELSKEKRKLFRTYFNAATQASELKEIVQKKRSRQLNFAAKCESYIAWQAACAKRNAAAYHLKPLLVEDNYKGVLNEKAVYYIQVQADRHEEILKQQGNFTSDSLKAIEEKLAVHLEPLLYKLFPDTPVVKVSNNYRIGKKGSLSVTCSGSKIGQFYDFENQEGGGPLQLLEKELRLNKAEVRQWALEFLGETSNFKNQSACLKPSSDEAKEEVDWSSLKPDPNIPAPKFEELGKLHHYYNEVVRHPYYDKEGDLLYYVLRLENDEGKKITPPLSYGKFNEEEPSWQLKGYKDQSGKHPLYGLEKLESNPLATVVIVEGEKAADLGAEKFLDPDKHICLSWSGGASSVSKADWSALEGRKVLVWGDYDSAGMRAQHEVCAELKKLDNIAIKVIDHDLLYERDFPNKWDLADPLPEKASEASIHYIESKAKPVIGDFNEIEKQVEKQLGLDKNLDKGFGLEL